MDIDAGPGPTPHALRAAPATRNGSLANALASVTPAERIAALAALCLGLAHLLIAPDSGTDLAAQLARASFARAAPLTPVDLSWYSGVHPFGYSLLTPWIMAALGVAIPGLLAAVAAALLFARLLRGQHHAVPVALLGAVFSVADVVSGRTTFALSAVALLAALLRRERPGWAISFGVLTALLSPVGAAFLALIAAALVLHRRRGGWTLGLAATVPTLVLAALFPGGGLQPFPARSALPAVAVAVAVAVLTEVPIVRTGALLYGVAVVFFALHHDPFGSNVLRLGLLVAAPVLLATRRRLSPLTMIAVVAILAWQAGPPIADLLAAPGPELHALTAELVKVRSARAEVVPPRDHRESWTVAERVPLARGWGRQIDERDNRLFYAGTLTGPDFLAWLRGHAVDHVAVPRRATVDFGGRREVDLLRHPVDGLRRVWSDRDWIVLAVDAPRPIAGAPAQVVSSTRTTLTISSRSTGAVPVALRWSRWLTASGPGCLSRRGDRVIVRFRSPGTVTLGSGLWPRGHC